jgi:hypothetical protein
VNVAELTPKTTMGPEIVASRRGVCSGPCISEDGESIVPGRDYIAKVDGVGWMHALCAQERCRGNALNEEAELIAAERQDRDERFRRVCRELRNLDFPESAIETLEHLAETLDRRAA